MSITEGLDERINAAMDEVLLSGYFDRLAAKVKAKPQSMAKIETALQKICSPVVRRSLQQPPH